MRVLKPEDARNRKEKILNWVVFNYVNTGRPVSSDIITKEGGFNVSSATIRNVLKELEEEGFLFQPHTSGGRIPTDKGYRAYVDNVSRMQRMASQEKERLEREYERRIEQLDGFLKHTSRMLSEMSQCAGFVMSADTENDALKRIELVSLASNSVLAVIVPHSGIIKNTAFVLRYPIDRQMLREIATALNARMKGLTFRQCYDIIHSEFMPAAHDARVAELLGKLADYLESAISNEDALYMDGLSRIYSNFEDVSPDDMRDLARLLEEKERFSGLLRRRLRESSRPAIASDSSRKSVDVTIGSENNIKEFKNFSLVSSSYRINNKTVGMIGILGYKRMAYPRMISLVETVSRMMEDMLEEWDKLEFED
ncbi:MAG: heat-inducible transcription repressor HrcA [Elusimicrobiales bacterium]|nr:heat-inducible transcription repressor HrcA [Elusimicrobiales bacterium]